MIIYKDSLHKKLYAQDASMYQEEPMGVAFPASKEEIQELVRQAQAESFTITTRSAGTSLAGQTTGKGVIMDVSRHLTSILEVDDEEETAIVEPGVIRDSLNREAAKLRLLFGPDTSTTNRCMIGGMIGNNSSGLFSIKYKTTREHVLEMDVVLSDGSEATFRPLSEEELEDKLQYQNLEGDIYRAMLSLLERNKELIEESFPHKTITRRNTGYALDKLCEMHPITPGGRDFNLCELLCGSEGTLAVTTSAKLKLMEVPKKKTVIVPHFKTLDEAMKATVEAVRYRPAAVELVDRIILDATKGNLEHARNRFFLRDEPEYILIIQFDGEDEEKLEQRMEKLESVLRSKSLGYAFPKFKEPDSIHRVWEVRRAGLGLLMGLGTESRTPAFCEDTAVRVQDLPEYVKEFEQLLKNHETECVFYAHASVGELHFRPMIDTTHPAGVKKMKTMAKEIAELVGKYKGSLSGEHGDGRARAPFIEYVLGEEMLPVLKQVKEIWDPNYVLNPGKIVEPIPMQEGLRYAPSYKPHEVDTQFNWRKEGSFNGVIELCNGAGVCRKRAQSGGTMCPSYMATNEEVDSTRGRANVFRQVFSGENPEGFGSRDLKEALDLCLSCKACKSECPANVDMAKMKAEFVHGWHLKHGINNAEWFFGNAGKLYPMASKIPWLTNFISGSGIGKFMMKQFFGISSKRKLPSFSTITFQQWFKKHTPLKKNEKVTLFVDLFTNYHEPGIAVDAVKVLEHLGYQVMVPEVMETGRPQLSKGLLHDAKAIANECFEKLRLSAELGIPIIGLEPSEILTLRDEFLDLVPDSKLEVAKKIAENSFTFEEFILENKSRVSAKTVKNLVVHNHCHSKALIGNDPIQQALEIWGYNVDVLDAGCCGMAGSFGYEDKNYEVSMQIGGQRLFPGIKKGKKKGNICAPGFSCRHQIKDGAGVEAYHPASLMARLIPNP